MKKKWKSKNEKKYITKVSKGKKRKKKWNYFQTDEYWVFVNKKPFFNLLKIMKKKLFENKNHGQIFEKKDKRDTSFYQFFKKNKRKK